MPYTTPSPKQLKCVLTFPTKSLDIMDEVFPNLYIGGMSAATDLELLQGFGITHVLNAAKGKGNTLEDVYKDLEIKYLALEIQDNPSFQIQPYFKQTTKFISQGLASGGNILVHCQVGVSRSATLVLAYLMMEQGMNVEKALSRVRDAREICPNGGFLQQLCDLDRTLTKQRKKHADKQISREVSTMLPMNVSQALARVQDAWEVYPNGRFLQQLSDMDRMLRKNIGGKAVSQDISTMLPRHTPESAEFTTDMLDSQKMCSGATHMTSDIFNIDESATKISSSLSKTDMPTDAILDTSNPTIELTSESVMPKESISFFEISRPPVEVTPAASDIDKLATDTAHDASIGQKQTKFAWSEDAQTLLASIELTSESVMPNTESTISEISRPPTSWQNIK